MRRWLLLFYLVALSTRAAFCAETDVLFELQRRAFDFFWFEANPKTGLVKDRAGNFAPDDYRAASIAATGFGLAAIPVGVEHGWITRRQGEERAILTLRTFLDKTPQEHGWYYHFVDTRTGERMWKCELSSIDTALFLAGALVAGGYFKGEPLAIASTIFERVDFPWMLTDGGVRTNALTFSMGWKPESGFIKSRWDHYSEHLILGIMAMGSTAHPVPAATWTTWKRDVGDYKGHKTFASGPLFTHQYSQAFLDLRDRRDSLGFNYFDSSVQATLANRQFCIDQAGLYKTYGTNV